MPASHCWFERPARLAAPVCARWPIASSDLFARSIEPITINLQLQPVGVTQVRLADAKLVRWPAPLGNDSDHYDDVGDAAAAAYQ